LKDLSDLPSNWITVNIESVTDSNPKHSKDLEDELEISFIPMSAVDEVTGTIKDYATKPLGDIKKGYAHFANGDVIFAKITPCMENGKCAVAKNLTNGIACGSTEFQVLRPNGIVLAEYLYRYLRQESYRNYAAQNMTGVVGQRRVPRQFLLDTEIPLPPLNEQRRIVSTIEQLTDRSHRAQAALEDVPKLIAQFRQSVLAAAFRGDLTADWREKNPDIEPASEFLQRIGIESQSPLDFLEVHSLPQKWKWASVGSISKISGGLTRNSKREEFPLEYPYLRVANVYANKLDLQEIKTIRINQQELARVLLEKGDLLVVEGNGSIDQVCRVAMWDGSISPCLHQNHLIKIRFNLPEMGGFALLWLLSEQGRRYIMSVASSSSGLHTLSLSKVSALPIPVAPENEQKEIVKRITALFDALTVIENRFTSSEEELNQLDRSILAKAFRGELVPQDPNDEPAAVLLERIRAERAGTERSRSDRTSTPKQRGKTTRKNSSKQLSIDLE
jgi:type I restriction enzyme, S subunit